MLVSIIRSNINIDLDHDVDKGLFNYHDYHDFWLIFLRQNAQCTTIPYCPQQTSYQSETISTF